MRNSRAYQQQFETVARSNSKRSINCSLTAAPYAETLTISLWVDLGNNQCVQELIAIVSGRLRELGAGSATPEIKVIQVFPYVLQEIGHQGVVFLVVLDVSKKTTISRVLTVIAFLVTLSLTHSTRVFAADAFPGPSLAGNNGSLVDSNIGMTGQAGEPLTLGGGALNTQWYSWTAPLSGFVSFGTCNPTGSSLTNFDTTIGIYTGAAVNALTQIGFNDDTPGCNSVVNPNFGSTVAFNASAGTTYRIQVDGYANATGQFNLFYGYAGYTATPTVATATEGGATGAFTVVLKALPTGPATITIGASTQCTFSPTALNFSSANWNVPQTVTVTAIDDTIVEGTHFCAPSSITPSGGGVVASAAPSPTFTITDNDTAAVTINKSVNSASIAAPSTLTYTVTVANTGSVALHAPVITDTLAQGTSLALTSGPTLTSGDAAPVGTLNIGETWLYSATYAVTQANINNGTSITNKASFATTEAPLATSNTVTTTITRNPQLTILKIPSTLGPAPVGTSITYTYKITNSGNVAMTSITVSDVHNGSGVFTGPGNETLLADAAPAGDSADAAPNGTWDTLAPGDILTFTATYAVTQHDVDFLQ
jgi:uncharacterized repeat protein (TIGR01451 family)